MRPPKSPSLRWSKRAPLPDKPAPVRGRTPNRSAIFSNKYREWRPLTFGGRSAWVDSSERRVDAYIDWCKTTKRLPGQFTLTAAHDANLTVTYHDGDKWGARGEPVERITADTIWPGKDRVNWAQVVTHHFKEWGVCPPKLPPPEPLRVPFASIG